MKNIGGIEEHILVYWLHHFVILHGMPLDDVEKTFNTQLGMPNISVRAHSSESDLIIVSSYTNKAGEFTESLSAGRYMVNDLPQLKREMCDKRLANLLGE